MLKWALFVCFFSAIVIADGPMDSGEKYYIRGLYSKAVSSYKKALEYDINENNRALCWYMIGQSYLQMNHTTSAKSAFNQIRSKYTKTAWLAPAYVGLGDCYYKSKDYKNALKAYENSMTKTYLAKHGSSVYYRFYKCHSAMKSSKASYYVNVIKSNYPKSLENRVLLSSSKKSRSPAKKSSSTKYAVQISYTTRADFAQEYATKIKKKGYKAYVTTTSSKGKERFKILVGEYNSIESAKALLKKITKDLKIDGFVTTI